jgi:DNA polymerase I-like protein with 3'-5' exonuclease and polymerase domains
MQIKESPEQRYKRLHKMRKAAKVVTYSALYGVGAAKLAREMKVPQHEAKSLLDSFWKMNWAVEKTVENLQVKNISGVSWLYNPISGFYYSLRSDRDKFSTLNQGSGVYVFDTWVKNFRAKRPQLTAQFHDEVVLEVKKGHREKAEALLRDAMKKTNEELNLNVTIDIDVQFGDNYGAIH